MPWEIREENDRYCVHRKDTGELEKCHMTKEEAEQHMAALYASEDSEKSKPLLTEADVKAFVAEALKVGARHSGSDQKHLQSIHDSATALGAMCPTEDGKSADMDALEAKADLSLNERLDKVHMAVHEAMHQMERPMPMMEEMGGYPVAVFDDYVIIRQGEKFWQVSYTISDGMVQLADKDAWQEVEQQWVAVKMRIPWAEWPVMKRQMDPNVGGGVDRDKLETGDFVFGDERKFPVVTPGDVSDAVSSWGRYKGPKSFEQFKRRLIALCKRKGAAFVARLPQEWKDEMEKSVQIDDLLIAFGEPLRATKSADGTQGFVEALGIRYGNAQELDLDNDWFGPDTYFGPANGDNTMATLNHRLPIVGMETKAEEMPVLESYAKRRFQHPIKTQAGDLGILARHVLNLSDEYEKFVFDMVQKGKLRWSSGTAPHLVERDTKTHQIKQWPIVEWAYTPTPAEPRLPAIMSLKTWAETAQPRESLPETARTTVVEEAKQGGVTVNVYTSAAIPTHQEVTKMGDEQNKNADNIKSAGGGGPTVITHADPQAMAAEQFKAILSEWSVQEIKPFTEKVESLSETVDKILKAMQDDPAIRRAGYYTVDGGKADPNVKSFGDFLLAVQRHDHRRLVEVYKTVKTLGEDAGDTGGYLIPEAYSADLLKVTQESSQIVSRCTPVPVAKARSGTYPYLDVMTAPTTQGSGQSSMAAGMVFGSVAESGTVGTTEPRFEMMRWQLYKRGGIVPVSSELNADSPTAIEPLLRALATVAVRNQMERDVIRGPGGGEPLGILNAGCRVEVSSVTSSVFAWGDVGNLYSRFKGLMGDPIWIMHPGVWPDILNMTVSTGVGAFQANPQAFGGNSILGWPIVPSEHSPQDDNTGDVILADLKSYLLFLGGGMEVAYSEHAYFTTDRVGWRFIQRMDGMPWLRSTITLADPQGSYTVSPFCVHND